MHILKIHPINTPLGKIISISDENYLYLLEFEINKKFESKLNLLQKSNFNLIKGITKISKLIELELESYFNGTLKKFKTPYVLLGTDFQKKVWMALSKIPYGHVISYKSQSEIILKPKSYRAVANANGNNHLAIIIPCHRVINNNGEIGGYGSGLNIKRKLLEHEENLML